MKVTAGDVVSMKSFKAEIEAETNKFSVSFSAGRGNKFVFILLGVNEDKLKLDPEEELNYLGWFSDIDESAAKVLLAHYEKELLIQKASFGNGGSTYESAVSISDLENRITKLKKYAALNQYRI